MLRFLTIGVLLTIGLPVYGHQISGQSSANQQHSNTAPQPSSPSPSKIKCVIEQDGTTIECDYTEAESPSYLRRFFSAENAPNLLLVLVGIGGIIAAGFTLHKIERQIKVAEGDTHAKIRAERAWIVVSVKEMTPGVYVFSVKNEGNTPAKVDSVWCNNSYTPRESKFQIPTDDLTDKSHLQNPPFLLPPKADKSIWQLDRAVFENASGGGKGEASRFARGFGMANIYGRIRYYDVLENPPTTVHETRFLYLLIPQPGTIPIPDPFHSKENSYS